MSKQLKQKWEVIEVTESESTRIYSEDEGCYIADVYGSNSTNKALLMATAPSLADELTEYRAILARYIGGEEDTSELFDELVEAYEKHKSTREVL